MKNRFLFCVLIVLFFKGIFMVSITTCYVYSNTEVFHPTQTTYFWAITWIVENIPWRLYVCYLRTRSNFPRTFSFYVAIMNALAWPKYTDFLTNVSTHNNIIIYCIMQYNYTFTSFKGGPLVGGWAKNNSFKNSKG